MQKLFILSLFLSWFSLPIFSSPLSNFLNADNLRQASVGVLIKDMENGMVVVEHEASVCRIPASVTKVITTATALELLSDTFHFRTQIEIDGRIDDTIISGNLYVKGGGDPTLESAYDPLKRHFFQMVIDSLSSLGVKGIKGNIIGDASIFREDGSPFNWLVEDVGSSYAPTPSALSVNDNLLSFVLNSDSCGFSITKVSPPTSLFSPTFLAERNELHPVGWRFSKKDFSWSPQIVGNFPIGTSQLLKTEIPEPAMFVADSLRRLLMINGINVDGKATTTRWHTSDSTRRVLFSIQSATLEDIEKPTNHKSINLFAENIFKYLSFTRDKKLPCVDWSSAIAIERFWRGKGIHSERNFQVDGSGMSMKNALSPEYLVDVLTYMNNTSNYKRAFLSSLPTAGKTGTVRSLLKGTILEGKVLAKSGSMCRVKNYAGYIFYKGKKYAFCIMVSNFSGEASVVAKQIGTLLCDIMRQTE